MSQLVSSTELTLRGFPALSSLAACCRDLIRLDQEMLEHGPQPC